MISVVATVYTGKRTRVWVGVGVPVHKSNQMSSLSSETLTPAMSETYDELLRDVSACGTLESLVCGKGMPKPPKTRTRRRGNVPARPAPLKTVPFDTYERVSQVVKVCRVERKRARPEDDDAEPTDAQLFAGTRFTDGIALKSYEPFLHYVPRLVNIVRSRYRLPRPAQPALSTD